MNPELTVYHYKEPLLAVPAAVGFGYYGALSVTTDGEWAQCHICGKLVKSVAFHSYSAHKVKSGEYKERFQLARQTALVSDSERERMREKSIRFFASLMPEQKRQQTDRARVRAQARIKAMRKEGVKFTQRLETKNVRGTCPDQLLEKIRQCAKAIGHTPTMDEFHEYCDTARYIRLIIKTFGTWLKGVEMAGLTPLEEKRPKRRNGKRYEDDELLEYLVVFYHEHMRLPTGTDCRRGWLPHEQSYIKHFGSLPKARKLAGLPEGEFVMSHDPGVRRLIVRDEESAFV